MKETTERLLHEVTHLHPWGSTQRVRALSLKTRELLPLPADCFDTCVELPFENIQAKVPAQYHAILTAHYGDYMQIPPGRDAPATTRVLPLDFPSAYPIALLKNAAL